jgi:hypothetical protein
MLNEMSEAQWLMLQAAAAREDRLLQLPANTKGAAAKSIAGKLIDCGWVKETKALDGAPVWRKDVASGSAFALKLTAKGLKAIAASGQGSIAVAKAAIAGVSEKSASEARSRQTRAASAPKAEASAASIPKEAAATASRGPRAGSKLEQDLVMLTSEAGATIADLTAATGWLEHSTRAALTGLRHRGYELSLTRGERSGVSVYRIAARGHEAAK